MSITVLLVYISISSDVLPLLTALYNYKRLDRALKLFALYCLISFLFDLLEMALSHLQVSNNCPLLHLYDLLATLFFVAIYYHAFYKPVLKKIALILGGLALTAIICNAVFVENIWIYP
ncbi:MAG: hypothetical protein ABI203_06140, partial [Mucilaginibacter sp.]